MEHAIIVNGSPVVIGRQDMKDSAGNTISAQMLFDRRRDGTPFLTRAEKVELVGLYEVDNVIDGVPDGPDTTLGSPVYAQEADRVTRTRTRRALTSQEIDGRGTELAAKAADEALGKAMHLAFNAMFFLARNPHNANLTLQQFRTAIENPANQVIDPASFRAWLKDLL
jgi:hypothetical protein